jgi:uncharacterized protein YdaU (DUF1376 family)
MNGLPYYKAYPRDFVEGTIGMPFEIKCAYRVVIDLIYMQGGDLPDDARYISGHLGCSLRKWNAIRDALVEMGKLQVSGGFLTNYRADKELEMLAKLQDKMSENARQPRKNKGLEKPLPSHTEPEPDTKKEPKGSLQKKRGTRLPDNWFLPLDWGQWAVDEGYTRDQIKDEADRFKDYWIGAPGQKGVKLDWFATWRNWIRNSKQRKAGNGKPAYNGNATGQQDRSDPALENIFRLAGLGQASGNGGR